MPWTTFFIVDFFLNIFLFQNSAKGILHKYKCHISFHKEISTPNSLKHRLSHVFHMKTLNKHSYSGLSKISSLMLWSSVIITQFDTLLPVPTHGCPAPVHIATMTPERFSHLMYGFHVVCQRAIAFQFHPAYSAHKSTAE